MKNTKVVILLLIALVIIGMSNIVKAETTDSYKISLSGEKTTIKPQEEITISLKVEDINIQSGEKGIGAYEGTIEYDTKVFEDLKVTGTTGWDTPIINEGKFTSVKSDGICTSEAQELLQITLKVKADAEAGETAIKVKGFEVSNGDENIGTDDASITVKVEVEEESTEQNKVEENTAGGTTTENNTAGNTVSGGNTVEQNKTQNKVNTVVKNTTGKNGSLPKTGITDVFMVIVVIAIVSGIYSFIRYKSTY